MAKRKQGERWMFTVQGSGEFPFDMLRYDECWPYYGEDSTRLSGSFDRALRRVVLATRKEGNPTDGRWHSFGWEVVEVGYPTPESRTVPAGRKSMVFPAPETHLCTPRTEDGRIAIRLSDADIQKIERGHPWQATVTDLETGRMYDLKGAACSLSTCFCDAVVVREHEAAKVRP